MTDISDGLIADLSHIADTSGVRIDLDTNALVIPEAVSTVAEALGRNALEFMLNGGDSYALAATFSLETPLPDGWTRIGEVLDGAGVTVDGQEYDGPAGHQHFR
jgi:thiamine-monophosphate kinase